MNPKEILISNYETKPVNLCGGIACGDCPINQKCKQYKTQEGFKAPMSVRDYLIRQYIKIQKNLEQW